jgi:hypothetical protein
MEGHSETLHTLIVSMASCDLNTSNHHFGEENHV